MKISQIKSNQSQTNQNQEVKKKKEKLNPSKLSKRSSFVRQYSWLSISEY